MSNAFYGASNLTMNPNAGTPDMRAVTSMYAMFYEATSFNGDISRWNTAQVTNMQYVFDGATSFNQDLGRWNTEKVTSMTQMFYRASSFNQDIGRWNVEAVTSMSNMFNGVTLSPANYDALLTGWNAQNLQRNVTFHGGTSKYTSAAVSARANMRNSDGWRITDGGVLVTSRPADHFVLKVTTTAGTNANDKSFTFYTEDTNYDIDWDNNGTFEDTGVSGSRSHTFNTAGVHTIRFRNLNDIRITNQAGKAKYTSIEQWGTAVWNVAMDSAFYGARNLTMNSTAGTPDMRAVTNMAYMFNGAYAFNGDISGWNTSAVMNMRSMFNGATSFNQNIGRWNTAKVTDMSAMFSGATSFNQNIGRWNTAKVTDMSAMFSGATSFDQNIGRWNTAKVTDMTYMFWLATSFNQDIGRWNTAKVTYMTLYVLWLATSFDQDIGGWNTASVTDYVGYVQGKPLPLTRT